MIISNDYSKIESIAKYRSIHEEGLKIITSKQMFQRLPIALASNTSEKLLNEIHQIIYSLNREEEVTKNVYNNIMNLIKLQNRIMDTIFMNTGNSKTSDPHRFYRIFRIKINLKRSDKYAALSNLSFCYAWKNIKNSYKNNKFKISALTWNEDFELAKGSYSVSYIQDYFEYI